jgi:ABC-type sugar transport system ATPase subunit
MTAAVLECRAISKRFGATQAVREVSFVLASGEVLALVGENGAGKSTLMNLIAGALTPDSGSVLLDGAAVPAGATARRAAGVAMVHQELSLFGNLTVAENLLLGAEPGGLLRVDDRALRARVAGMLAEFGLDLPPDAPVASLSPAHRQLVEIVKAVAAKPQVLILDEPTSSLENPQVDLVERATRRLASTGTAVVFVSHRLDELFRFCDTVLVLRGGEPVARGSIGEFDHDRLVTSMVGRPVATLYPSRDPAEPEPVPALELDRVSGHRVHDVSLTAYAGRIAGIAGLEGHGQGTVAEIVAGVRQPSAGTVRLAGRPVRFADPRQAVRAGVGYVPPDRRTDGLMLALPLARNITVTADRAVHGGSLVRGRREARAVRDVVARLALRCASLDQPVSELSGGNQQKALFGRWLLHQRLRLLVLNDPTRGVDIGARAEIYQTLRRLTDDGVAIVLVSSDMQELLGLADEIYVMYTGRVTGQVSGGSATEEEIMALAVGGRE